VKILIVGGNSSIGKALKSVLSKNYEVITAGRTNCDSYINLEDPITEIKIPDYVDIVINAVAHFGGQTGKLIYEAENINVLGLLKLCEVSYNASVKHFISISSIFSFLKEDAQQYSIYSISKRHAEEVIKEFCRTYSLPLTILRPGQVYGNVLDFKSKQPFLYHIISQAAKGLDINLYGSNDAKRNFIHIDDLTQIIEKVIEQTTLGSFDCLYMHDVTYSQIAKAAYSVFNKKGNINFIKDKPDIPDNIFEKDFSLYEKIDFYPEISIEKGIKKIAGTSQIL